MATPANPQADDPYPLEVHRDLDVEVPGHEQRCIDCSEPFPLDALAYQRDDLWLLVCPACGLWQAVEF